MIIGLVGKPSSGKSTFFKASTLAEVAIAPYPFTTIEKNEGIGFVKVNCVEKEFNVKCQPRFGFCLNAKRFVPVKLIDVAGLVPEAHKGKGRGNEFLDNLREADVLIHILDASGKTDAEGNPTEDYDVVEEVKFLQDEIDLWFYSILSKNWDRFSRRVSNEKRKLSEELARRMSGLKVSEDQIIKVLRELDLNEDPLKWDENNLLAFTRQLRKESKPIIIAANKADVSTSNNNIEKLREEFPDSTIIPCSAEIELSLREAAKHGLVEYITGEKEFTIIGKLTEEQERAMGFIKGYLERWNNTGVQQCINEAVFSILRRIVVYPVENENKLTDKEGRILPDAYIMPSNSTALDLAEKVHSDLAKNFIAAIDIRTKKKLGKDYKLRNGDVIKIVMK